MIIIPFQCFPFKQNPHCDTIVTIFKTYENDLDGIGNKLGFSQRSFAKWKEQVSQAFNEGGKGLQGFRQALSTAFNIPQSSNAIQLINQNDFNTVFGRNSKDFFKNFNLEGSKSLSTLTQWCNRMNVADETMRSYLVDCMQKQAPASFENYSKYAQKAIASTQQLTIAQKASATATKLVASAGSMAANMALMFVISEAVSFAVKAVDEWIITNEEAIEQAEELRQKFEDIKSTTQSNISTLKGLDNEFKTLSKGVGQYGENVSLTTDEYERYKEIIQQIVGISPELSEGYSIENGFIADKNGLLERAIELQEEEYKSELKRKTAIDNLKTAMKGYLAEYNDVFGHSISTEDMDISSSNTAYDMINSLKNAFNVQTDEDTSRKVLEALGFKNIDKEIEKYMSDWGGFDTGAFWSDYADTVAENIDVITHSLDDQSYVQPLKERAQSYREMKDAVTSTNDSIQTELGYIAQSTDAYSALSAVQQQFVSDYLSSFNVGDIASLNVFGNLKYDEDKMLAVKQQIIEFVESLSQDKTTQKALADLYAAPTDGQSVDDYMEQFKNAMEIIQNYCEEKGIEIPVTLTQRGEDIDRLEEHYQNVTDVTQNKYDGYNPAGFFEKHSVNTQQELDTWLEIIRTAESAAEAEENYICAIQQSFEDVWDSADFSEVRKKLLDLAKSGELTAETIDSTEEYADLLSKTGLSAEEAMYEILGLINAHEKLVALNKPLEELSSSYKEFQNLGFVTAETLSSLPDVLQSLDGFDAFSQIIGDPTQGEQKIQQAFDDIIEEYLRTQDTLSGLFGADRSTIQSYIANLKEMGIANADAIINYQLAANDAILSSAQQEQNNVYQQLSQGIHSLNDAKFLLKLESIDLTTATDEEIQTLIDEANALHLPTNALEAFQTQKLLANNETIRTSEDINNLLALADAAGVTTEAVGKLAGLKSAYDDAVKRGDSNAAAAIADQMEKAAKQTQTEVLNFKPKVNYTGTSQTSASHTGINTSDSQTANTTETPETFNFIDTLLKNLSTAFDKLKEKGTNTFLSFEKRVGAYGSALKNVTKQIKAQQDAYNTYMAKADAVGLSSEWMKQVQNGHINIAA